MEAHQLQLLLQGRKQLDKTFTHHFYKKAATIIETPWDMTTTEISRHPNKERINYKTKISAMVYETNISTIRK